MTTAGGGEGAPLPGEPIPGSAVAPLASVRCGSWRWQSLREVSARDPGVTVQTGTGHSRRRARPHVLHQLSQAFFSKLSPSLSFLCQLHPLHQESVEECHVGRLLLDAGCCREPSQSRYQHTGRRPRHVAAPPLLLLPIRPQPGLGISRIKPVSSEKTVGAHSQVTSMCALQYSLPARSARRAGRTAPGVTRQRNASSVGHLTSLP